MSPSSDVTADFVAANCGGFYMRRSIVTTRFFGPSAQAELDVDSYMDRHVFRR
ncbi:MAG TPA: hypothetical protein VGY48_30930 [Vicinamibacterales bacterium]|jgi:hypothetical protein|nr:hypothetical protein [Vicinamibacterales bacterium]